MSFDRAGYIVYIILAVYIYRTGTLDTQQIKNILMFPYVLEQNPWLQNAASIITVANVLLQEFAINKMQCIVAIDNFFDNTNRDAINYDSVVLI